LQNAVKGVVYVYTPLLLLAYHTLYSVGCGHHIQNESHDCRGLPKLRVLRQNPPVGSAPPRANRARDKATQRVVSS
jgi:hypothetical protein